MGQTQSTSENQKIADDQPYDAAAQPEDIPDDYESPYDGPFVQVLYGSQTGKKNAQSFAHKLAQKYAIKHSPLPVTVKCMDQFEPEHLNKLTYLVLVVSTYTDGTPPTNAKTFYDWLQDAVQDFRIQKGSLSNLKYTVFGLGSSDYKQNFNVVANNMKKWLKELGAKPLCRSGVADYSDSVDCELTPDQTFERWAINTLLPAVQKSHTKQLTAEANRQAAASGNSGAGMAAAIAAVNGDESASEVKEVDADEYDEESDEGAQEEMEEDEDGSDGEGIVDVEDMGQMRAKKAKTDAHDKPKGPRKMLTEKQRSNLVKQGYKIIGSHSGVKLCRWTKAMLRGRGGCYKHTFYGIISYQCMEMTPSLACANKCVFCWRSYTNPVGTEWTWETDRPELVFKGALENHRQMIATLKGVPGVQPQRFQDALKPKHCALSLVGEPIMYPFINEFMDMLHGDDISTFLVTNAQFPEQLRTLTPVTQLYLSIDAHSPESLKAVDRPLNADYWERYIKCMELLKFKKQRTVYRLTLVKGFNMDEVSAYARLVNIGNPTFIEIKGVTYCGNDDLSMVNVPFHEEVRAWCERLCESLDDRYELACEHRHSCCILIADKKMKKDGQWHTWIDYPKFQSLVKRYKETGEEFTDLDYSAPTPDWAVWGAKEEGFSPHETRVRAKGKNRDNLKGKETEGEAFCQGEDASGSCCKNGEQEQSGCCKEDSGKDASMQDACCGDEQGCKK